MKIDLAGPAVLPKWRAWSQPPKCKSLGVVEAKTFPAALTAAQKRFGHDILVTPAFRGEKVSA